MPKMPSSPPDELDMEVGKERPPSSPPRREIDAVASMPRVWMVAVEISPSSSHKFNVGNVPEDEVGKELLSLEEKLPG